MAEITRVDIAFSQEGNAEATIKIARGTWPCSAVATDLPADLRAALKQWFGEAGD
jgi:hypothetical protein